MGKTAVFEIVEEPKIEALTSVSVTISILQKFTDKTGNIVGENKLESKGYVNSQIDRKMLQNDHSPEVVNAVFAMWGDKPTLSDPEPVEESES